MDKKALYVSTVSAASFEKFWKNSHRTGYLQNSVDLKGCILMKRLIRQLKAKEKTVIISSHLIASLREICDIIHYLNEGVIYKEYFQ